MKYSVGFRIFCHANLFFAAIFLAMPVPILMAAEDEKPTGEYSVSAMSGYIYRGYELSRNSVVVQPSMTIGYRGFSANLFGTPGYQTLLPR